MTLYLAGGRCNHQLALRGLFSNALFRKGNACVWNLYFENNQQGGKWVASSIVCLLASHVTLFVTELLAGKLNISTSARRLPDERQTFSRIVKSTTASPNGYKVWLPALQYCCKTCMALSFSFSFFMLSPRICECFGGCCTLPRGATPHLVRVVQITVNRQLGTFSEPQVETYTLRFLCKCNCNLRYDFL